MILNRGPVIQNNDREYAGWKNYEASLSKQRKAGMMRDV